MAADESLFLPLVVFVVVVAAEPSSDTNSLCQHSLVLKSQKKHIVYEQRVVTKKLIGLPLYTNTNLSYNAFWLETMLSVTHDFGKYTLHVAITMQSTYMLHVTIGREIARNEFHQFEKDAVINRRGEASPGAVHSDT